MLKGFYISLCAAACFAAASHAQTQNATVMQADSFVDSIGVRSRLCFDSVQRDPVFFESTLRPRIQELGIRHLRDAACQGGSYLTAYTSKLSALAQMGISLSLYVHPILTWDPDFESLSISPASEDPRPGGGFISKIKQIMQSGIQLRAIDSINEWDHVSSIDPDCAWSQDWYTALQNCPKKQFWKEEVNAYSQALWQGLHADPATQYIEINAPSFVHLEDFKNQSMGAETLWSFFQRNLLPYVTRGNGHIYCWRKGVYRCFDSQVAPREEFFGSMHATETGYYTETDLMPDLNVSTEIQQAKYLIRGLFSFRDRWPNGMTYIYELMDSHSPEDTVARLQSFGILKGDGAPKLAFTTLKNVFALLSDPGPSFQTQTLDHLVDFKKSDGTFASTNQNIHLSLFQKRSGSYYFVLRNELNGPSADTDSTHPVRIRIGESFGTALEMRLFDPSASSSIPIQEVTTSREIYMDVPDKVLILEVKHPEARPPLQPTPTPISTPASECTVKSKELRKGRVQYVESVVRRENSTPYGKVNVSISVKRRSGSSRRIAYGRTNSFGRAIIKLSRVYKTSSLKVLVENNRCIGTVRAR